jgi:hypothetical protein
MTTGMMAFGYSEECNARCAHCIVSDGSPRTARMPLDTAERILADLAAEGVKGISFTLGEPLLHYEDLRRLIRRSDGLGLFTRVVTSAYWASSAESADRIVAGLRQSGLSQLRVSCSRWHQADIPLENVANAARTCEKHGLNCFVSFLTDFSPEDDRLEAFLRERRLRYFPDPLLYFGAAARFRRPGIRYGYGPNRCVLSPTLTPSLDLFACCGPGVLFRKTGFFHVGNLGENSVHDLLRRMENHGLFRRIRTEGLTSLAVSLGFSASRIVTYPMCELCREIFDSREHVGTLESQVR